MDQRGGRPPAARWWSEGVSVGRLFGVPIYFAPSWFLIAAFITWQFAPFVGERVPGVGVAGRYVVAAAFALLLFGSVLVHEVSHSVVARALGLPVRRIVLQLLGGVSEITEEPPSPAREYLVTIAGPLTSVFLGGLGAAVVPLLPHASAGRLLAAEFAWANALVAAFNLLPGLPLDGGRVLRAALWHLRKDKVAGTLAASWVGRGLAVAVALLPLGFSLATGSQAASLSIVYFLLLAMFIWYGATQALVMTRVGAALPSLSARRLTRRALPVTAHLPLAEAVRRAQEAGARALVVVDGHGAPESIVSEAAVMAVPMDRRPWVEVAQLSRHIDPEMVLSADLGGQDLLEALRRRPASEYLVVEPGGGVFGVLSQADVAAALAGATQ